MPVASGGYVPARPRLNTDALYTLHDSVVYAAFTSGTSPLLSQSTARLRHQASGMTAGGGHATGLVAKPDYDAHEHERVPASRMLDFEAFVTVSSGPVVELAALRSPSPLNHKQILYILKLVGFQ